MSAELFIDVFRAVTPYINMALMIAACVIGWFLKTLLQDAKRQIQEMKVDVHLRFQGVEDDIKKLEKDHAQLEKDCVQKDVFYMAVGEQKALVGKIFDELKELNKIVHQNIGAIKVMNKGGEGG